ncbi:MAG: peptidase M14 [Cyclobacteriaceae bacterium]|nr:peptidase M14 [Cyclobacteriaceae bacterium]
MKVKLTYWIAALVLICAQAIGQIPKPSETFGFEPGADYKMATYDQMLSYYEKLDAATDRVKVTEIGKSVRGRPMKLIFISSEENMKSLDKWRDISEKLARARISEKEAQQLAKDGKAIIWFDGGMHASEKAHAQMTPELLYRIAAEESDEMKKIRDNVITLVVPVINPDGLDIEGAWYRKNLGTIYETSGPPILYQEYVGHDNNRDWFMGNMPETKAVMNVLYNQWYPQIIHNHHQSSPAWARIFIPPFRSPVNSKIHPGVTTGVNLVGTAMGNRFAMKKMPGAVSMTTFEMWWNGGMRTAPYYHNMIGILTETAHTSPTPRFYPPDSIPKIIGNASARDGASKKTDGTEIFYAYPWKGGESHFRDAVDYMLEASMAVLDLAAEKRDELLYNIYSMGRDAIEDTNGAFAYVIPKSQWDHTEAVNLVNVLMRGGIEVEEATSKFKIGDTEYDAGTYVMYGSQPFRPYLSDLMEKQDYPDLYLYPGGPPIAPYDLTGWTLPMSFGVKVDRVTSSFTAKTKKIQSEIKLPAGSVSGSASFGYALDNRENLSATAINRLLKAGEKVSIAQASFADGKASFPAGTFVIEKGSNTQSAINNLSKELGVSFSGIGAKPSNVKAMKKIKIGLYKSWDANIDEGWTRWVLEQFEFDLDTLHNADIKTKNLSAYTAIIIPSQSPEEILIGHRPGTMPEPYVGGIGLEGTIALNNYVQNGGTLLTFDQACDLAIDEFGLPVDNVTHGLSSSTFFIPGSIVRMNVNTNNPLAFGMQPEAAASFSRSRAFETIVPSRKAEGGNEVMKPAPRPDVTPVATYASKDLLMSGWGLNADRYIKNKGAMMNVGHGKGNVVLFGFRPQFRGQARNTYKLIFNSIYLGATR